MHLRLAARGRTRLATAAAFVALAGAAAPAAAQSGTPLYPDLKTLAPSDLRFATVTYNGVTSNVLRFSNTVWNAGQGPLELRGEVMSNGAVNQAVYDGAGGVSYVKVHDDLLFHPGHQHFHFQNFAQYELWTKAAYDKWVSSGRSVGQANKLGDKTSFCIMDTRVTQSLPGTPSSAAYAACGMEIQGLSVGWGDTYGWSLPEQWIDLGDAFLSDGTYVLRSVADPLDKLHESPQKSDKTRESVEDNEAITVFTVKRKQIRIAR